ncbi:hypothetical protein NN3_46530 [Nocardia neocaledoniensis NBRC 108232]|uniref:DUF5666 domain-containing protein n=1 Tax=Nocardia neocaledoniensis TaxID=236511 RepID=A0A317NAZ8_9NOCA|nr:hypothetical protein [Nocardia neocaledoniensis]PWV72309.1 hypothetical protein DFR69_109226 [Nocardia neocaledoniensis]GEM33646.1 hypothetical protein NN3_46530 [Nocardia neocaledoniensis NBRC 108232]
MKRVKKAVTTGAVLATTAIASVLMAGAARSSVAPGAPTLSVLDYTGTAVVVEAEHGGLEFEFAATHYVVRSCYFEQMNRQGATGPHKFDGKGKTKDAAERDADAKANRAAGDQGMKLKHCRTESHSSKR